MTFYIFEMILTRSRFLTYEFEARKLLSIHTVYTLYRYYHSCGRGVGVHFAIIVCVPLIHFWYLIIFCQNVEDFWISTLWIALSKYRDSQIVVPVHFLIKNNIPVTFSSFSVHRDLNFDSHKRFCTRDFTCWLYVLDHGGSKKDCLSSCRNKSSHANPQVGFEPGTSWTSLLDWILLSKPYNINFREIHLIKSL